MSVNTKMKAIADEVRELLGTSDALGLDAMASNLVEANAEVDSQVELLAQAIAALEGKASGGGVTLPTLDNPASASDILNGKKAINSMGNVITGAIETFDGSYECSGEGTGGSGDTSLETCTVIITSSASIESVIATTVNNNSLGTYAMVDGQFTYYDTITVENVLCGSTIAVGTRVGAPKVETVGGVILEQGNGGYFALKAPTSGGVIGSANIYSLV